MSPESRAYERGRRASLDTTQMGPIDKAKISIKHVSQVHNGSRL